MKSTTIAFVCTVLLCMPLMAHAFGTDLENRIQARFGSSFTERFSERFNVDHDEWSDWGHRFDDSRWHASTTPRHWGSSCGSDDPRPPNDNPLVSIIAGNSAFIPAQFIAVHVSNQPLGGFFASTTGAVTVNAITFNVASTSTSGAPLVDVVLVNSSNAVVAGPVNETSAGTLIFPTPVTFPLGNNLFTIRGRVASTTNNNATITLSTNPTIGWTDVHSASGPVTPPAPFTMNTMTVKKGALAIGPAATPASRSVQPGTPQFLFAQFNFDATQSGEDVRFSQIPVMLTFTGGTATNITICQIYDGAIPLSTGSNTLNPVGTSPALGTITLDNPLNVTKATIKTLGIKCSVDPYAPEGATFSWDTQAAANFNVVGFSSGSLIVPTDAAGSAPVVTIDSTP